MITHNAKSFDGGLYALGAFLIWGFFPLYWKLLKHIPSIDILCHRILWSAFFLSFLCFGRKAYWHLKSLLLAPQKLLVFLLGTLCIGCNWYLYLWAVLNNKVMESSLGYFINPLFNVLLGFLFLRERLRAWQWPCLALALTGVLIQTLHFGHFPWVSCLLTLTFGFYGLLRKLSHLDSLHAVYFETLFMGLPSLAYLAYAYGDIQGIPYLHQGSTLLPLIGGGLMTSIPLVFFGHAAKKLPLTTLGLFQYLSPSCQFLIAVFLFHEPLTSAHILTFSLIWSALALFSLEGFLYGRRLRTSSQTAPGDGLI